MPQSVCFYFDYASPFAYLANERVPEVLADFDVIYSPIYLRGLEEFSEGPPFSSRKMAYAGRDLARCAADGGIKMEKPATFPVNGLYALRGALVAQELGCFGDYHQALFRGVWSAGLDIGSEAAVLDFVKGQGLDPDRFGPLISSPEIKTRLTDQTARAQAAGAFGVPTFVVGDELFWGTDRLEHVRRACAA